MTRESLGTYTITALWETQGSTTWIHIVFHAADGGRVVGGPAADAKRPINATREAN